MREMLLLFEQSKAYWVLNRQRKPRESVESVSKSLKRKQSSGAGWASTPEAP